MDRRTSLSTFALALAGTASAQTAIAQTTGGVKLTVLYNPPKSPEEFEKYYFEVHMPLVAAVKGIRRTETSKGLPQADGSAPTFYRIFEAWFDSPEQMAAAFATPEWAKVRADLPKVATGGATRLITQID